MILHQSRPYVPVAAVSDGKRLEKRLAAGDLKEALGSEPAQPGRSRPARSRAPDRTGAKARPKKKTPATVKGAAKAASRKSQPKGDGASPPPSRSKAGPRPPKPSVETADAPPLTPKLLARLRAYLGWSRATMSFHLNVGQTTIHYWENYLMRVRANERTRKAWGRLWRKYGHKL